MKPKAINPFSFVTIILSVLLTIAITASPAVSSTISKTNSSIILNSEQSGRPDLKSVNGRIEVGDGLKVGNVKTTNGRISLGEAVIAGTVRTTNGRIAVGDGSEVEDIRTTNGSIQVQGVNVDGDIRTTNGSIKASDNTKVEGHVITSNGGIYLDHTTVGNDVRLRNGSVNLSDSLVKGDIIIEEDNSWSLFSWGNNKKPRVIIGPNSEVKGSVIARQDIELYIHESAKVGSIEGAEAEYYSGDRP
jgi:hypothetical protein